MSIKITLFFIEIYCLCRDAGKACASISLICPICRQILCQSTNYVAIFECGHGYHLDCLGEPRSCYKCLNAKGWAPVVTNIIRTSNSHLVC